MSRPAEPVGAARALTNDQRLAQRVQRKQDLLLASTVLRGQAAGSFHELADQVDGLGRRWVALQAWFDGPALRTGASTAAALMLVLGLRRLRWMRLARWTWLGWRAWRLASPWLRPWLAPWLARQRARWSGRRRAGD